MGGPGAAAIKQKPRGRLFFYDPGLCRAGPDTVGHIRWVCPLFFA